MKEDFLHYIWQHQAFDKGTLLTAAGEPVQVITTGYRNFQAGPDFLQAKVKIGEMLWCGAVEIHIKASDWHRHHHHDDAAYDHVVLHVVWVHDKDIFRTDNTPVPVIALSQRVEAGLLARYEQFFRKGYEQEKLPLCRQQLPLPSAITVVSMMETALIQRIEHKAAGVLELLENNRGHWAATCYQWMIRAFGFKVNVDPFLALSKALPWEVAVRLPAEVLFFEAALLGQAGFLAQPFQDTYLIRLQEEYEHIASKFQLKNLQLPVHNWKFSRMRPPNFPTVRITQLAVLLSREMQLLDTWTTIDSLEEMKKKLHLCPSAYWQTHSYPERTAAMPLQGPGEDSINNLLINFALPLQYAYARYYQHEAMGDRVLAWLEQLPAEHNRLTRQYRQHHFPLASAFDSQAIIGLHHHYCSHHRCLSCKIGTALIHNPLTHPA